MRAAIAWFRERGLPRVMLWKPRRANTPALALFRKGGFRETRAEMTLELPELTSPLACGRATRGWGVRRGWP